MFPIGIARVTPGGDGFGGIGVSNPQAALDQHLLATLKPAALAGAALFYFMAFRSGHGLGLTDVLDRVGIDIAIGSAFLVYAIFLWSDRIPSRWIHWIWMLLVTACLAKTLDSISLRGDPARTHGMAMLLLAVAFTAYSTPLFLGYLVLSLVSWVVLFRYGFDSPQPVLTANTIWGAVAVAFVIHRARTKTFYRMQELLSQNESQKLNLEAALASVRRDLVERERAETVERGRNRVLRRLATGATLGDVLTDLVAASEEAEPEMICSVLLLDEDGKRLRHVAAPSLPDFYNEEIDGLEIGPNVGSCGSAAFLGERVIVEDVSTHPFWESFRDLALRAEVKACWSEPIIDSKGEVLGTFAMYYRESRLPQSSELDFIRSAAHLAGIAIESKQAEEALRTSEKRMRLFNDNSIDFIWTTDMDFNFTYLSPAAERLWGFSVEPGMGLSRDDAIRPHVFKIMKVTKSEPDPNAPDGQGVFQTVELKVRHRDGSWRWSEALMNGLYDEDGEQIGFQGVIRDMSDRRKVEEEKVQLEEQLRHSQKLEAIGTLAGGIAHDFNNLLTGILGYADLLKQKAEGNESVLRGAEVIEKAADRAKELTGQLLGFARKGKNQIVPLEINEAIEDAVALLERMVDKNIQITKRLRAAAAKVQGDPNQIEQVFVNLAVNARDAMPDGGSLIFETDVVVLDEEYCDAHADTKPGQYVMISVSDTGTGISKDVQERIFEPFFTTKGTGEGSGMGLAMVYGIIQNHEGSIRVYSEPGHGSSFKVYLPLSGEWASEEADDSHQAPTPGTGNILLVDDEDIVRQLATDMLEHLGYNVVAVNDGQEAVDYYSEHLGEVDLAIIDMIMPVMGGKECFEELLRINPEVRAILSTGYSRDGAAQEIMDRGMLGFAQKPYRVSQLSEVVAKAIN